MKRLTLLALLVPAAVAPLWAQSADEQTAYRALIYTPPGAFTPLAPNVDSLGRAGRSRTTLTGRLGHISRNGLSLNSFGLGVELPVGRWLMSGTLGYLSASCDASWFGDSDCSGDIMLGASARRLLTTKPLGEGASSKRRSANDSHLVVSFEGSGGFSPKQGEQAMAIAASLPTSLVLPNGNVRIMPFLTPALAYGRMSRTTYDWEGTPTSYGALTYMIGGGLALQFVRSGITANVGFQRVMKSQGGATQLGIGMVWQGFTTR